MARYITLSGSGRSPNIIRALEWAKERGMDTFAIFGKFGSPALLAAEHTWNLGDNMQHAEETQLIAGHEAMLWLKANP